MSDIVAAALPPNDEFLGWYAGRNVLVTGGAGFIGSHVVDRLLHLGARVTVIDSFTDSQGANEFNLAHVIGEIRLSRDDLRDSAALTQLVRGQECVINLAGQVSHVGSMEYPEQDLELNCRAQLSLLEVLRAHNRDCHLVFTSTRQVYGKSHYLPVDESHPTRPTDINGINKLAAENYHLLYEHVYGIPTVVLRLTNTYGPRLAISQERQGVIPEFLRTALKGGTIELFGGGGQRRDANYVDDVVDALLRAGSAAKTCSGEVFNLGAEPSFSLREFADLVVTMVGAGVVTPTPWPDAHASIDVGDYQADYGLIVDRLGWKPVTDLQSGLAATVDFFKRTREHYW